MYYRGADVALVVFDITQRVSTSDNTHVNYYKSSFEKAQKWISDLDKDTVIALVGNKTDMESNRTVTTEVIVFRLTKDEPFRKRKSLRN